jgi:CRP-like cAMP-binding protein
VVIDLVRMASAAILNLGPGQSVGEMSLVDTGVRSATCRAATDNTLVASITRDAFERLVDSDPRLGYRIMRNIAADLSFRLRHRTMADL